MGGGVIEECIDQVIFFEGLHPLAVLLGDHFLLLLLIRVCWDDLLHDARCLDFDPVIVRVVVQVRVREALEQSGELWVVEVELLDAEDQGLLKDAVGQREDVGVLEVSLVEQAEADVVDVFVQEELLVLFVGQVLRPGFSSVVEEVHQIQDFLDVRLDFLLIVVVHIPDFAVVVRQQGHAREIFAVLQNAPHDILRVLIVFDVFVHFWLALSVASGFLSLVGNTFVSGGVSAIPGEGVVASLLRKLVKGVERSRRESGLARAVWELGDYKVNG